MLLDVLNGFGSFYSFYSISGTNKMLCIAGISQSEPGYMATRGPWKVGIMFSSNPVHIRLINTSYRRDSVSREVVVELDRGYSIHDGGG